jgi:hypothetical protein
VGTGEGSDRWTTAVVDLSTLEGGCLRCSGPVDLPDKPTPRTVTGKLVRMGPEEAAFDAAFWRGIPAETRVELLWDMVLDALALKGEVKDEPRLQRSVGRMRRR